MSKAGFLDARFDGAETTISFSRHTFHCDDSANRITQQVCDLIQDQPTPKQAVEEVNLVNLDFSKVDRISSAGLNGLIRLCSRSRNLGFRMVLINVCPQVREIFELTRLERMFDLKESAEGIG